MIDIRLLGRWLNRARARSERGAARPGAPFSRPLLARTLGAIGAGAGLLLLLSSGALGLMAQHHVHREVTRALDVAAQAAALAGSDAQASAVAKSADATIAIVADGRLIDSGLPAAATRDLDRVLSGRAPVDGTAILGGERFAFRRLRSVRGSSLYALASIDARSRDATHDVMTALAVLVVGTSLLVAASGLWVVRTIARPIETLSASIEDLASTRDLRAQLAPTGISRELDTFTEAFNHLLRSLAVAERATETAYIGAIRALAAAVDARDPNTAGHSERVSALAVAVGQTLGLSDSDLETLRLGALLHDIGKICVPDSVLRKPDPLTEAELTQVKKHPVLGARILRSVPFLAPHISIVELHHERPDGQGYPYGLRADATPMGARIVHVADAYDAMTSTRAHRARRSDAAAMTELWRYAGSEFDAEIVEALARSPRPLARAEAQDLAPAPPAPEPSDVALV